MQILIPILAMAAPLGATIPQPVKVDGGLIAGVPGTDSFITVFQGIPFAAPSVGDLRWREARSVVPWQGVRKADRFGNSCIQNIVTERKPWTYEFMTHNQTSEDCLYLNVWAPAKTASERLPVYFWIHGGGNVEGSAAVPVYDGENLARRGVVVVTINYRLGVIGFLAHPELTRQAGHSGNYGSLDQLTALRWVQKNIASFGGDPGNVTISGQSAGSSGVHNLVASPLAKGLFQRAVAESGSGYGAAGALQKLAVAEEAGVKFAATKGAQDLKELRAMTPEKLMAKIGDGPVSAFRPVIDGHFLVADPAEVYAQGKQNDVPELTGMTQDERSSTDDYGTIPLAAYRAKMQERYVDLAAVFFDLYPNRTQEQSGGSQKEASRDSGLVSLFLWAEDRQKTAKNKAYTYYWTHPEPSPDRVRYGAFHTSEVPYIFNTLNQSTRPWTDQDRRLADTLGAYWVNFMKTGDPNGNGLPQWPAFASGSAVTMELGDKLGPRALAVIPRMEFWQKYLARSNALTR